MHAALIQIAALIGNAREYPEAQRLDRAVAAFDAPASIPRH